MKTKHINFTRTAALGLACFAASAHAQGDEAAPLFGSNTCHGADIRVLNSRSDSITVRSVEYYNYTEQRWQTENLANKVVSPGAMEFWWENLERTDRDLITSFNVTFDHGSHNGHVEHVNTPDQSCATGRVYLLEIS